MKRALGSTLLVTMMAAAYLGCPAVDVTVAVQSEADAGEEADVIVTDTGARVCTTVNDCGAEEYCQKSTCDSPQGVCMRRPLGCSSTLQEDNGQLGVCGCNGVIYWNDCLRALDGVPSSTTECGRVVAGCGEPKQPCPVRDAVCGFFDPGGGGMGCAPPRGQCWVLPFTCPGNDAGPDGPGGPPAASCGPDPITCTNLCLALSSQRPFGRALPLQCQ